MKTHEFPPDSIQWFHPQLKEEVVFVFSGYYVGLLFASRSRSRRAWDDNQWYPIRTFTPQEQAAMMADLLTATA
jgi:hypothetical protein